MSLSGRFTGWTLSSLIRQLRNEGLEIPDGIPENTLVEIAQAHYGNGPIPNPPQRNKTRLQYVPSPQVEATIRVLAGQQEYNEEAEEKEEYLDSEDEDQYEDDLLDGFENEESRQPSAKRNVTNTRITTSPLNTGPEDLAASMLNMDRVQHQTSLKDPSLEEAKRFANQLHPRDDDFNYFGLFTTTTGRFCLPGNSFCDIFWEGTESELLKYGVGISLYFKYLKLLFWVYFLICLLAMPQIAFNRVGAQPREWSIISGIYLTSIGNLVDEKLLVFTSNSSDDNTTFVIIGADSDEDFSSTIQLPVATCDGEPCLIDRSTLSSIYFSTDILITLVFLCATIYMRFMIPYEKSQATKNYRTIEQYTVEIKNLPYDTGEASLKTFLEENLEVEVHDVVLAKNNGPLIELYLLRGEVVNRLWDCVGMAERLIKKYNSPRRRSIAGSERLISLTGTKKTLKNKAEKLRNEVSRITNQYDNAYTEYLALNKARKALDHGSKSILAYVTFEDLNGFRRCLRVLSKNKTCSVLDRRDAINTQLSRIDTGLFTENTWMLDRQYSIPKFESHKLVAFAAPPPSTIKWENLGYSVWEQRFRRLLTTILAIILIGVSFGASFIAQSYRVETLGATFQNLTFCNFTILEQPDDTPLDPSLVECVCGTLSYTEAAIAVFDITDRCHDYWFGIAPFFFFTGFATAIIALVNIILGIVAKNLANFEKHKAITFRELSIGKRLFIGYYFNVGFVLVIVNASISNFGDTVIGRGQYEDFTSEWYSNVGTQLVTTVIINALAPHVLNMMSYLQNLCRRINVKAKVQSQLNEAYIGPEFIPSVRYAQTLTMVMVSMTYGAGMPILYVIGCITFATSFCVDKLLVLRYYRNPPEYGADLTIFASYVMLFAPPIHLGVAIWMYSTPGVFIAGDAPAFERMTQSYPAFIVFILCAAVLLLDSTLLSVVQLVWTCLSKTKVFLRIPSIVEDEDFTIVTEAKRHGLFGSILSTYNMLENDVYMRAFGIDLEFARTHRDLNALIEAHERSNEGPQLPSEFRFLGLGEVEGSSPGNDGRDQGQN